MTRSVSPSEISWTAARPIRAFASALAMVRVKNGVSRCTSSAVDTAPPCVRKSNLRCSRFCRSRRMVSSDTPKRRANSSTLTWPLVSTSLN
jgi:hypothetical protein